MAYSCSVLSDRSDFDNDFRLLRKCSDYTSNRAVNLMPDSRKDSRDATVASVQKSHSRRPEVVAMASWLGIAEGS